MERLRLNSRHVTWVSYNEETKTLHVWGDRERHRMHANINEAVYRNLIEADPPDFYYNFYIANQPSGNQLKLIAKAVALLLLTVAFVAFVP